MNTRLLRRLLFGLVMAGGVAGAVEDDWSRSLAARGRVRLMARQPEEMQRLGVWSERSIRWLETAWGQTIPFHPREPLVLMISPEVDQVELQQAFPRDGTLRQRVLVPEDAGRYSSGDLARAWVEAMAARLIIAANRSAERRMDFTVPEWLIAGSAPLLLSDGFTRIAQGLEEMGDRAPFPELVMRGGRRRQQPLELAEALVVSRWFFQRLREHDADETWRAVGQESFADPEFLVIWSRWGNDLRAFHQHWDIWWLQTQPRLISEFRLNEASLEALKAERLILPAWYGLKLEDVPRTRPLALPDLKDYLEEDPLFGWAVSQWILRLQVLRFRQSPALNTSIEAYQQAGRYAVRAANTRGSQRREAWERMTAAWDQAERQLLELIRASEASRSPAMRDARYGPAADPEPALPEFPSSGPPE